MNIRRLIFFISISFLRLWSEENLSLVSQQAEALRAAHDYSGATALYESLLSRSLPRWQQARIFYNLATLRLDQDRPAEAFEFFQKITPIDLSLPQFGRDLLLNQGIAYLQNARQFSISFPLTSFDEQAIFIEQALQTFDQAKQLTCYIQELEQTDHSPCQPYPPVEEWIKYGQFQLQMVYQKKREELKKINQGEGNETAITILKKAISQAHGALQGLFLSILMPTEERKKKEIQSTLRRQQQDVLTQALLFIPAVLREQQKFAQQTKKNSTNCQKSPWDQVIPLFDHGVQFAKSADEELGLPSWNMTEIQIKQEQTIKDWEEALALLLHPPKEEQDQSSTAQNLSNTFRMIQEMYQQDQSSSEQTTEELHTW